MSYYHRSGGDTSQTRAARIAQEFDPGATAACTNMNDNLKAASVPGHEYGHPTIVIAHRSTPAAWLIERAQMLNAQSRFAGMDLDREWDPE